MINLEINAFWLRLYYHCTLQDHVVSTIKVNYFRLGQFI